MSALSIYNAALGTSHEAGLNAVWNAAYAAGVASCNAAEPETPEAADLSTAVEVVGGQPEPAELTPQGAENV